MESNINELEHCGLNRHPDRGFHESKRYVGIAIAACNLKRISREMQRQEKQALKKTKAKGKTGRVKMIEL